MLALGALCVVLADDPARGVRPGADAGDPRCGRITERVPRELGGRARDGVDLPGVAVWGDGDIVLRCGAEVPAPSVDPCFEADGVDWVMDLAKSTRDRKVVVTYGRRPATEVTFAAGLATTDAALLDLSAAVAPLVRQTDRCIGPADVR
ncbi:MULTISPECIES: DUF3515 family protein [unclassified Streptomyces]|uniref:DUF3515 family protein n=1 Tax=unclassified Streptomyces TaxID=2593676 RepID=UPI00380BB326